jgi:hypothetical protein
MKRDQPIAESRGQDFRVLSFDEWVVTQDGYRRKLRQRRLLAFFWAFLVISCFVGVLGSWLYSCHQAIDEVEHVGLRSGIMKLWEGEK